MHDEEIGNLADSYHSIVMLQFSSSPSCSHLRLIKKQKENEHGKLGDGNDWWNWVLVGWGIDLCSVST